MTSSTKSAKHKKRRKIRIIVFFSFLLFFSIGLFLADRWVKKKGFAGIWDFVTTVGSNYISSWDAKYETAEITISQNDFDKLEQQRQQHLKRGIITKSNDRYVAAIISFNGKKIKCKLRLKGHMTDHLQDEKWSFRIKTVGGDAFKGMKIFSLMHPGTRNYIYEWIYHQMLEDEGIATVRYSFLNLKVNGESWGIYAVEENFAEELLGHHERPDGPIIGFNPDLYWNARLNEFDGKEIAWDDMDIKSSFPEAYDEDEQFKNAESKKNYVEAIVKLEKFKRGELMTSQIFDIDKLARFHALLDLVGGQFSLDWSDVKYYYNPVTQKVEPVGYESFSVRNTFQLCGASRFKNEHDANSEWHEYLFSDPKFFIVYMKHLLRISQKKYLNSFFAEHAADLHNNLSILYSEFPYKKMPINQYFINQVNIKALLDAPVMPVVYLEEFKNDSLKLTFGCNSMLPVKVSSLVIADKVYRLTEPIMLSARKKNEHVVFESHVIPVQYELDKKEMDNLSLNASLLGFKKSFEIKVKPIGIENELADYKDFLNEDPNVSMFNFIATDLDSKEIIIKSGIHVLDKDLIIPAGFTVKAMAPLTLTLNKGAAIISNSPLQWSGNEENHIIINSTDSTGKGIILLNAENLSTFKFIDFVDLAMKKDKNETHVAVMTVYESPVKLVGCIFTSGAELGISIIRSKAILTNVEFFNFKKAIQADYSTLTMTLVSMKNIKKDALDLNGSNVKMENIFIDSADCAISADNASSVSGKKWNFANMQTAISATDNSNVKGNDITIKNASVGFHAEKKSDVFGPASISITGLKKENVKRLKESDNKSKITIK